MATREKAEQSRKTNLKNLPVRTVEKAKAAQVKGGGPRHQDIIAI